MSTTNAARVTGLAYLGLAVSGVIGFLLIRDQLYVPGDAVATAANLVDREGLARVGIAVDLAIVGTQAMAALWFYRLFRPVDSFAAGAVAAFGLVNSVVILVATMFSVTALQVAISEAATSVADPGATSLLLYDLNDAAWGVGALFFGLWLIPMGWLAWRSGHMPPLLGWILILGGAGYSLSAFIAYLAPDASAVTDVLTLPATVGEFWMIGYLLVRGVRRHDPSAEPSEGVEIEARA